MTAALAVPAPPPPTDSLIHSFSAPVPPEDVPRFMQMAEDLKDRLSHCRTFAGIDTIRMWTQPAETARGFEAVLACMVDYGDGAEELPLEHIQGWAALNRPGVIVGDLEYQLASEWFASFGTSFSRPTRDIHGDRLPPRSPAGLSRAGEVIEMPTARWFKDLTPAEVAEWREEQAEMRQRDADEARKAQPRSRFTVLNAADLEALPTVAEIIRGVLPATGIGANYGASMSGKTFVDIDMLDALSRGRPDWCGHKIPAAVPCVYVGLEGAGGIPKRMKALGDHKIRVILPGTFDLRNAADRVGLVEAVRDAGAAGGVLVIDTWAQACPGMDENSGKDVGEAITGLKALQAELGGLVLIVAHTGKDQAKGLRGHSSMLAALDCAIEVRRDGDRREWVVAKSKDGEDGASHPFSLDVVQVGRDADGEPVTTCVVRPEQQAADAVRRVLPPKAGNQKIVWEALVELFRFAPVPDSPPMGLPAGRACLQLETTVETIRTRLVCDGKRQTERTQSAITGLINRGLLVHQDGWIWHA